MKIKFKLEEYEDILDQYSVLFDDCESLWVDVNDKNCMRVSAYRVVISKLNLSFRDGEWYVRNEEIEDPDDSEAWEFVHSAEMLYAKGEKNPDKFVECGTDTLYPWLKKACEKCGYPYEEAGLLNCYIETAEFIDEETVNKLFPKNWKAGIEAKYPELFSTIKDKKYKVDRDYDGAKVTISSDDFTYIRVLLRSDYLRFEHCGQFVMVANTPEEIKKVYDKSIELIKDITEEKIAIVYVFGDENNGRKRAELFVPIEDARKLCTEEEAIEYLQNMGVDVSHHSEHGRIAIDVYFWNDPSRRFYKWKIGN